MSTIVIELPKKKSYRYRENSKDNIESTIQLIENSHKYFEAFKAPNVRENHRSSRKHLES